MKKVLVALALFSLFCIPAFSQDTPLAEVYGGYQLLHDGGEASDFGANESNSHGFIAAFEGNITSYFGIVGEFGYNKHTETLDDGTGSWSNASYLFGPRFGYRAEKYRVFFHYLIGVLKSSAPEEFDSFERSYTNISQAVGGGVDIVLNEMISVRPFQIDLLSVRASDDRFSLWSNHFRYSGGVVFKFGSK